jgi:hypothetical protein
MALSALIDDIKSRIGAHADLVLKLHDVVAGALGQKLNEALAVTFDIKLAESSLKFFSLADVPAIRGPLPPGVSDVHFRADLSGLTPLTVQSLIDEDPIFCDLLHSDYT